MPERSRPSFILQIAQEFEVPLIDILNELRMVKQERRQLRTRVESVGPQQPEEAEEPRAWDQSFAETTSKQDALAARAGRIETYNQHNRAGSAEKMTRLRAPESEETRP